MLYNIAVCCKVKKRNRNKVPVSKKQPHLLFQVWLSMLCGKIVNVLFCYCLECLIEILDNIVDILGTD